jgi:hypothetical protein
LKPVRRDCPAAQPPMSRDAGEDGNTQYFNIP